MEPKGLDQITREDFVAYERVRVSGVINMWAATSKRAWA